MGEVLRDEFKRAVLREFNLLPENAEEMFNALTKKFNIET